MQLFLCRHGETGHKREGRIQGQSNAATLTARGRDAAAGLAAVIAHRGIDAVLSSPLRRARDTARIIASVLEPHDPVPQVRRELIEADLRDWQDQLRATVRQRDPVGLSLWQQTPHLYRTHEGAQPLEQIYEQAEQFLESLDEYPEEASLVVVGHRAINRAIINTALGLSAARHRTFELGMGSLSILERPASDTRWTLRAANLQHHLHRALPDQPPGSARVTFVRHGETDWNRSQRYQGRIDRELSRTGRKRGRLVADVLEDEQFSQIVTSPLVRAADTALSVARRLGQELTVDARLQEFDYGAWQGLTKEQVKRSDPGAFADWNRDPPQTSDAHGEPFGELTERCRSFLSDLIGQFEFGAAGPLVVSHDVVIRVLVCQALDLPLGHFWQIHQDNCGITALDWLPEQGSWTASVCNYVPGPIAGSYDDDIL